MDVRSKKTMNLSGIDLLKMLRGGFTLTTLATPLIVSMNARITNTPSSQAGAICET